MKEDIAAKPKVMAAQRKLLESRYNLEPKLDPEAKMSRGKPLAVGPTARLAEGMTWEKLARDDARGDPRGGRLPLPVAAAPDAHAGRAGLPARCRSRCSPGWSGSTSSSTCPRRSCPSSRRPSSCRTGPSWATSRGARSSRSTTSTRLFKDILTPVQLDGLRLLLTPFPQEEFNPTDDRKSAQREPGRDLLRLPRQRPHHRPVPPQPRHPPPAAPLPAGHDEPARHVQPADPRLEAEPALGRGLHRVRAADRLLQRRPDPRHEEGVHPARPRSASRTWPRCRTCSTSRPPRS